MFPHFHVLSVAERERKSLEGKMLKLFMGKHTIVKIVIIVIIHSLYPGLGFRVTYQSELLIYFCHCEILANKH